MSLPSVAVLLPTYNEEAFIDACLGSLAAQDYPALEVIRSILNDGESSRLYRSLTYEKRIAADDMTAAENGVE